MQEKMVVTSPMGIPSGIRELPMTMTQPSVSYPIPLQPNEAPPSFKS